MGRPTDIREYICKTILKKIVKFLLSIDAICEAFSLRVVGVQ